MSKFLKGLHQAWNMLYALKSEILKTNWVKTGFVLLLVIFTVFRPNAQQVKTYIIYHPENSTGVTPNYNAGNNGAGISVWQAASLQTGQSWVKQFNRVDATINGPIPASFFPASFNMNYSVSPLTVANSSMSQGNKQIGWNSVSNFTNQTFTFPAIFPGNVSYVGNTQGIGSSNPRGSGIAVNYQQVMYEQMYNQAGDIILSKNNGAWPNMPTVIASGNGTAAIDASIPQPRVRSGASYTVPTGWNSTTAPYPATGGNFVVSNYASVTQSYTGGSFSNGITFSSNFPMMRLTQTASAWNPGTNFWAFATNLPFENSVSNANGAGHYSGTNVTAYMDFAFGDNNNHNGTAWGGVGSTRDRVQMMPQSLEVCPTIDIVGGLTVCQGVAPFSVTANALIPGTSTIVVTNITGGTWTSSNASVATINASGQITIVGAGTSNITFTSADGCTGTETLTVNATPTVTPASASVCPGGTTTLTGSPAGGTWSTSNAAIATVNASGVVTGVAAGTATITYTANGCPATATVTVSATPTPTITTTAPTCTTAGTATITNYDATATYTFTPTGPAVGAGGVISGLTPNTSYTVTATKSGCVSSASSSFSVLPATGPPLPVIDTTTLASCISASIVSVVNYDPSFLYLFNPTGPMVGTGGVISGMTIGVPYTVRVFDNISCFSAFTPNFGIQAQLPIPTATAGSNSPVCEGSNINLTSNGGTSYSWMGPSSFTSTLQNPIIASATSAMGGIYTVTVTNASGCTASTTTNVTVTANNTVTGPGAATSCINSAITSITHTTTGATGIGTATGLPAGVTASFAGNTITISGTPTASGTFNYTIPLTGGCGTVNATGTITVNPLNTIAAGVNRTACINTAITNINLATTGATDATVTGLPAGVTGTWAANAFTISGTPTASGTFNYTVTTTGGCPPATATGTITVTANNTVTGPGAATSCINTAITSITHTTTGATGIGTATGLPAGVTASFAGNTITISGTPTASGTFNYTIPLTGGCGTVNAIGTITVNPLNTIAAGVNRTACINTAITNITLATTGATGATVTGLPSGVTGTWAANVFTISGTPTASGTFNYTVTTTGGCPPATATGTITVTANNTVTGPGAATSCINSAITSITHTTTGATGIGAVTGLPAGVTASFAGNTITISGTPTASGTFNYTIPLTGGCGTVNATGTIVVDIAPVVECYILDGGWSLLPTCSIDKCEGSANLIIAIDGGLGTYSWTAPAGAGGSANTSEYNLNSPLTAADAGVYTVTLTTPTGCVIVKTITLTVTPDNTVTGLGSATTCINTAITDITHTTTGATGIGTATGLPAGVTASFAGNTITISGTPTASGTFNYTIPLTGGCGTVNATGTITVNICQIILSGSVYIDNNGIRDNTISGTNNIPLGINAVLYDPNTNLVLDIFPLGSGNTFNFNIETTGTYRVMITSQESLTGDPIPSLTLPSMFRYVGENIGLTGTDGTIDGRSSIITNPQMNIVNVNFGIKRFFLIIED